MFWLIVSWFVGFASYRTGLWNRLEWRRPRSMACLISARSPFRKFRSTGENGPQQKPFMGRPNTQLFPKFLRQLRWLHILWYPGTWCRPCSVWAAYTERCTLLARKGALLASKRSQGNIRNDNGWKKQNWNRISTRWWTFGATETSAFCMTMTCRFTSGSCEQFISWPKNCSICDGRHLVQRCAKPLKPVGSKEIFTH